MCVSSPRAWSSRGFVHDGNSLSVCQYQVRCLFIVVMYTGMVPKLWRRDYQGRTALACARPPIPGHRTWALVTEHGLTSVTMSQIIKRSASGVRRPETLPQTRRSCSPGTNVHVTGEYLAELRDQAGGAAENGLKPW